LEGFHTSDVMGWVGGIVIFVIVLFGILFIVHKAYNHEGCLITIVALFLAGSAANITHDWIKTDVQAVIDEKQENKAFPNLLRLQEGGLAVIVGQNYEQIKAFNLKERSSIWTYQVGEKLEAVSMFYTIDSELKFYISDINLNQSVSDSIEKVVWIAIKNSKKSSVSNDSSPLPDHYNEILRKQRGLKERETKYDQYSYTVSRYTDIKYTGEPPANKFDWSSGWTGGALIWNYEAKSPVATKTYEVNDTYVFGDEGQLLYGLDLLNGELRWRVQVPEPLLRTMIPVADRNLIIGFGQRKVYVFDAGTGELETEFEMKGNVQAMPAVAAQMLYITDSAGNLYAYDLVLNQVIWEEQLAEASLVPPLQVKDRLYVGGVDGAVVSVSASDGRVIERYQIGEEQITNGMILVDQRNVYSQDSMGQTTVTPR
jgi:outer membrane protein assembly factor BamB